jgi:hypothetical protein
LKADRATKKAYSELGIPEGTPPDLAKTFLSNKLKGESENQLTDQAATVIEMKYGKDAADLYKNAPIGGKTEILKNLIEGGQRGMNVEESLGLRPNLPQETSPSEELEPIDTPKKAPAIDYDKRKTPAERSRSQENRYKINLPLYMQSQEKRQSYNEMDDRLNILDELSPQIGTLERLNINPLSGDLIIPAAGSPEAQRFVKTINDFTTLAKATYGSRVTNFDLQQFMRRLPTLANSEEGRRQIIQQMKIINEINRAYEDSLASVFEDHGGIRNIDFDIAKSLAEKQSKSKIGDLKAQFKTIGHRQEKIFNNVVDELKKTVPVGYVSVQRADGSMGYIPKDQLKAFLDVPGNKSL